jgi:hypothetical protein
MYPLTARKAPKTARMAAGRLRRRYLGSKDKRDRRSAVAKSKMPTLKVLLSESSLAMFLNVKFIYP